MIPYRPLIGLAGAVLVLTLNSVFAPATRAAFTDGGFESGTANATPPPPWILTTYLNPLVPGVTLQSPQTLAGLNLAVGGVATNTVTLTATMPLSQPDSDLGTTTSFRWPRYGNGCAIINHHGINQNVNSLSQTMTVSAGDVDPLDGQVHVRFAVAPLIQYPDHAPNQNPYCFIQLVNVTQGNRVLYSDFYAFGSSGIPWKQSNGGLATEIDYTDWQLVDIAPGSAGISIGDTVTLTIIASGCEPGGHWGEMYVDGLGMAPPGIFVSGTATLGTGNNCTYTFNYRNAGTATASGVVINFTTPANTTFQSMIFPPGGVATTPPVGSAGVVTATFYSPLPAGASGHFTVTVNLNPAALGTTVVARNYQISSSQETPLLGSPINTVVPILPTASATTVTSLTANSATLGGLVNPGGGATTAYFQYGTTTSYGSISADTNLAATSAPLAVSNVISGLAPSTTYHCRLAAFNSTGFTPGPDQTFTTSVGPVSFTLSNISPLAGGGFRFGFTNLGGLNFEVLGTTNVALPLSNWMVLGPAVENPSGQYQFTNPGAANAGQGFFRVRSP
jgi:uncharacterized repeat protein (TIGR01451 family)